MKHTDTAELVAWLHSMTGSGATWNPHRCEQAAARLEALQAVVDKLPKTADGVPVVPGMMVWDRHGMAYTADLRTPKPETCSVDWGRCYSSRNAANQAAALAADAGKSPTDTDQ